MKIMVVIKKGELGIGVEIRGKIQAPSSYGTRGYGAHEYGAGAEFFGIYQVRTRFGRRTQVKMKLYWPTNNQLPAQQAWRAIFSAAVAAWQDLSAAAKAVYNELAKYKNYSGFNLFLSEYLLSHSP